MALLFFLLLFSCSSTASPTTSASLELSVLLELKSSLRISDSAPLFKSWTPSTPPCNFSFITCSPEGNITAIDLTATDVSGTIPFSSLCKLPSLVSLSLGKNRISGHLSPDLAGCVHLRHLDLASNSLTGPVPDLSPLVELRILNLTDNMFTGPFPASFLGNLTELEYLLMGDNFFDRSPFPAEVLGLWKLRWLYLSNCSISGTIPEGIGNLTNLYNLEFADNYLSGEIPSGITKLKKLWQLELYDNSLTGTLPVGFGNLSNLALFDASSNGLHGELTEIKYLNKLTTLQLYSNNFSGPIPAEIGDFPNLVNISLYSNRLTGELPKSLGSSADFDFIDVSTNFLTGPIPPDMCKRGKMTRLLLLENRFTGGIPASYGDCHTLIRFRVNDNFLSGEVPPAIWALPNLTILDLTRNGGLRGTIAPGIGSAGGLTTLLLAGNQFSGEIPAEISEAMNLVTIDISRNKLTGNIPATIGGLSSLSSLHLDHNGLTGEIPSAVGSCRALYDIDLSGNDLSGEIPASMGYLPALNSLNLSGNHLSGEIPPSLSFLKLSSLDLSRNRLSGPVPPSLAIPAFSASFLGNPGLCTAEAAAYIPLCAPSASKSRSDRFRVVLSVVLIATAALLLGVSASVYLKGWRKRAETEKLWTIRSFRTVPIDEQEIAKGVKEENLIGKGGSGSVYRVALRSGETVAVKHVRGAWGREVEALAGIRHVNVVRLHGCVTCEGDGESGALLVYEYLVNGSLWERLHGGEGEGMAWERRYDAALGAARGLEHLHHGCGKAMVHGDVKSSNILLDEEYRARIADFGLARELVDGVGVGATGLVAGTHGYICPEYAYTDKVNEKSDVYSFGVVLMELVTGKRPIEPEFGENKDIIQWICKKMANREVVFSLLDPRIPELFHEEAVSVLKVGIHCTMKLPSLRPSMRRVVQMLEDAGRWRAGMRYTGEMDLEKGDGQFFHVKEVKNQK